MNRLFVYGSLRDEEIFCRVAGIRLIPEVALLPGYQCLRLAGESYPAIRKAAAQQVAGLLYAGVTAAIWQRLDAYEGEQYERRVVTVKTAGGSCTAATYVISPRWRHLLTSEPWDFEQFCRRDKAACLQGILSSE